MKFLNKYIIIICLSGLSCSTEVSQELVSAGCSVNSIVNTHNNSDFFQELLNETTYNGLTGVSLMLEDANGQFFGTSGFADLENNDAISNCQKFRVASLTKVFTAAAIMMLVEQNTLSLETPINQILSEETLKDIKRSDEATVKTLLNHTSGLANYDDNPNFPAMILNEPGKRISIEEKLDLIRGQNAAPAWVVEDFGFMYSNTNYLLLQLILEKISDIKYEDFVRVNIFNHLNLMDTEISTENPYPINLARGYIDFYDKGTIRDVTEWDAKRFDGEGAIISTSKDIFTFYKALLTGQLLNQETVELMRENRLGLLKEIYNNQEFVGHDGEAIGYSAEMWYLEEKELIIVLLSNQGRVSNEQPSIQKYENLLRDIVNVLE
ncbi:MAG: serine hydrolase domain-containing protein [Polaribacter sp.]|uniref:serine hydrolase domain-containing protein n=1 Tax=Polaribacter sp. TaxID=1920175 RepID=UPI003BAF23F5